MFRAHKNVKDIKELYDLRRVLGPGKFGPVYEAIHKKADTPCAIKTISKMLDSHFEGRLPYRLTDEGTAVGLYEIQQRYQTGEHYLFPVAQFRLTVTSNHWHLYWMRKFDAWWPYEPPARGHKYSLKARAQQILANEYGCFWG